jgi:hypothetical protein
MTENGRQKPASGTVSAMPEQKSRHCEKTPDEELFYFTGCLKGGFRGNLLKRILGRLLRSSQ